MKTEEKIIEEFVQRWNSRFYKQANGIWNWIFPKPDEIEDFCKKEIFKALSQQKQEIVEEIKEELELHTHDSIPNYTDDLEDGCQMCVRNQVRLDIINHLTQKLTK